MGIKVVCQNKKARFEYFIEETYEAGIILKGTEVKSLREGRCSLQESYARVRNGEIFIVGMHINPYKQGDTFTQPDPLRIRKLLLHKREIEKLIGKTKERGFTIVVTKIYFKNGKAKAEIGLGKGKKHYDKRESLKQQTVKREIGREFKGTKIKM